MFRVLALVTTDETFVLLRAIESIKQDKPDDEEIIDKLKDDITLSIVTLSGKEYKISVVQQIAIYEDHGAPQNKFEMRNAIVDQWIKASYE